MKVNLNEKQLKFLEEKFSITKFDVQKMDRKQWNKVRENCFEIETDELLDCEKAGGDCDYCDTEDYLMASSIIDLPYEE